MFTFNSRVMAGPFAVVAVCGAAVLAGAPASSAGRATSSLPAPVPAVSDYQLLTASTTPPTEAQCFAVGRRCFTATAMQNSYDLPPLYAQGNEGQGVTIAIIDSFGNPNMASDLANFDTQMGLPHMCGEPGQACGPGIVRGHEILPVGGHRNSPRAAANSPHGRPRISPPVLS